jgi:dihydrofolate synthase/folylpolyglutamate synthase
VGIDHTEFLGPSLSSIARDKSFISRRNRPFVVGPLPEEARLAAEESARVTGAKLVSTHDLPPTWENIFEQVMNGASFWVQSNASNLRVALAALYQFENTTNTNFNKEAIVSSLRKTLWPGRFDVRTIAHRTVIFDGAHNAQGFEFFEKQFLKSPFAASTPTLIFASLADKPWKDTILRVLPHTSRVVVTQVQSERAVPANTIQNHIRALSSVPCVTANTVAEALQLTSQENTNSPILVLGSLALIGEAMENLGLDPFEKLRNPS